MVLILVVVLHADCCYKVKYAGYNYSECRYAECLNIKVGYIVKAVIMSVKCL